MTWKPSASGWHAPEPLCLLSSLSGPWLLFRRGVSIPGQRGEELHAEAVEGLGDTTEVLVDPMLRLAF
jgi:hypothetical protein